MRSRRLSCLVVATALFGIAAGPAHAQQEPEQLPEQREGCLPAPTATAVRTPWPLEYLRPRRVWSLTEGAGVTVAVVDTGVDADTPQLVGRVREGIDVTGSAGSADEDCLGHGTFVAGIIGAAPMEGSGFTGVAPAVTILPVRVATSLEADQPGSLTPERLATGIRRAVDAGADVVNVSASTTVDDAALKAAVDYAERRDVVLVASVANEQDDAARPVYPAAYRSVVAVGAIDPSGARATFSATGSFVDLVAPGEDVISIGPRGGGHWQGSGTSYAAPFVAGTAALVRAYHPQLSAAQVRHRLLATAIPAAAELPDPAYGWGTVDPLAAVTDVVPEEIGVAETLVAPPPARLPPESVTDELGAVLAVVGVVVAVIGTFGMVWGARLAGAAQRRRWRRARILRVDDASSDA